MASAFTHAVVAIALGEAVRPGDVYWKTAALGVLCAVGPDLDVIGMGLGVSYGEAWGHRGMTHSLAFAAAVAAGLTFLFYRGATPPHPFQAGAYFFACGASHGVLDMLTDGGLGVALLAPFSRARYFLPWRPIPVSPIGIRPFFSRYGLMVLLNEIRVVWGPAVVIGLVLRSVRLGLRL